MARSSSYPSACRMQRKNSLRSEEHTSELQSLRHLVCRLLLEKKKAKSRGMHGSPLVTKAAIESLRMSSQLRAVGFLMGKYVGTFVTCASQNFSSVCDDDTNR